MCVQLSQCSLCLRVCFGAQLLFGPVGRSFPAQCVCLGLSGCDICVLGSRFAVSDSGDV